MSTNIGRKIPRFSPFPIRIQNNFLIFSIRRLSALPQLQHRSTTPHQLFRIETLLTLHQASSS
jgi:hypothetical protein